MVAGTGLQPVPAIVFCLYMTVGRQFILFTTHRAMLVRLASNAFYMLLWLCAYRVIKSEKEITQDPQFFLSH